MTAKEELQALLVKNRVVIFNSLRESSEEWKQCIGRLAPANPVDRKHLEEAAQRRQELADQVHHLMREMTKEMDAESKS